MTSRIISSIVEKIQFSPYFFLSVLSAFERFKSLDSPKNNIHRSKHMNERAIEKCIKMLEAFPNLLLLFENCINQYNICFSTNYWVSLMRVYCFNLHAFDFWK